MDHSVIKICGSRMSGTGFTDGALASYKEYGSMPARLRINVIANPGVAKIDFALWSLSVSAINACGLCIDSHEKVLREADVSAAEIHTAVRFAAVIQSAAVVFEEVGTPSLIAAE